MYREFAAQSAEVLEPGVRDLLHIAVDSAVTGLYEPGVRRHVRHALAETDVTADEILEVLQLVSVLGIHAVTDGVPILVEVARERGRLPSD